MRLIIVVIVLCRHRLVKSHSLIASGGSDAASSARRPSDVLGNRTIMTRRFDALLHPDTHVMALSAAVGTVSVRTVDSNSVQFLSLRSAQSERLRQSVHVVEEIFSSLPLQLVDNDATQPSIASKINDQSLHQEVNQVTEVNYEGLM